MASITIPEFDDASSLTGDELLETARLSTTVTITATTISAAASDNSFNDSGSGFVTAGFAESDYVKVTGFTGDTANNIFIGQITALTAAKMTIGGTDGDVIVDDAAGESVTISKWESVRTSAQDVADLGGGGGGGYDAALSGGGAGFGDALLLLHCEGTDASTTFTDSSSQGYSVTAVGNAQIDTAQAKFGSSSALFDGTGDHLSLASEVIWNMRGAFTIEMFVRFNSVAADCAFATRWGGSGDQSFTFNWSTVAGNLLRFIYTTDGNSDVVISGSWVPSTGTWYHVAVSRDILGTLRMFVDGSQIGSDADNVPEFYDNDNALWIGAQEGSGGSIGSSMNGWIDEVRITRAALYRGNFAAPTAAHPDGFLNGVVTPEDYGAVGDGSTDDNSAVASAIATGYDVFFQRGRSYLITDAISPKREQTLFGGGRLIRNEDFTANTSPNHEAFIDITEDGVSIKDLTFTHTGAGRCFGVTTESVDNIAVTECTFVHMRAMFVFKHSTNITFDRNRCFFADRYAFATGGDRTSNQTDGPIYNVSCNNNFFYGCNGGATDINHDTHRFSVSGNTVVYSDMEATDEVFDFGSSGAAAICSDGVVANNVVDGSGVARAAVRCYNYCENITFKGNVYRNLKTGTSFGAVTVIDLGVSEPSDITFEGELIEGGVHGYDIAEGNNIAIRGSTIRNMDEAGIVRRANANNVIIESCMVHENGTNGIRSIGGSNTDIRGCDVHTNGDIGVWIDSGDYASVTNCTIYNNCQTSGTYGLQVDAGSDFGVMTGNRVFDSQGTKTQRGVSFGVSDRWVVVGNNFYDNLTTNLNGSGSLTNSQVANNIT